MHISQLTGVCVDAYFKPCQEKDNTVDQLMRAFKITWHFFYQALFWNLRSNNNHYPFFSNVQFWSLFFFFLCFWKSLSFNYFILFCLISYGLSFGSSLSGFLTRFWNINESLHLYYNAIELSLYSYRALTGSQQQPLSRHRASLMVWKTLKFENWFFCSSSSP